MLVTNDIKRVRIAIFVTIGVFTFQFIDVFFLHSSVTLLSTNIFARIFGIIVLITLSGVLGFNLKKFCFKSYGWFFEVLYGILFSAVPIILVYFAKYIYFLYRGYDNLFLTFRPTGFDPFNGSKEYLINVSIYVLTLLLVAVFKEIFYRGYLITQFSGKYGLPLSILIQSIIYMLSFAPTLAYYLYTGRFDFQGPLMSFFLICGHLTYNFISGIKWGLFYRVNGTVWMSVADHFLTNFIVSSFFFTESRLPEKWFIIEVIVIQLLSIAMFMPFFFKRDKQNELAAAEFALSREALKMGFDNYSPSIIRKNLDRRNTIKNEANKMPDDERRFEEPISLNDIKMPDESDLTASVRGFAINDYAFDYKTEVTPLDELPSKKVKNYFNIAIGRDDSDDESNESADVSNKSNAENISGLVKKYFDEDFEKHTF